MPQLSVRWFCIYLCEYIFQELLKELHRNLFCNIAFTIGIEVYLIFCNFRQYQIYLYIVIDGCIFLFLKKEVRQIFHNDLSHLNVVNY